MHNRLSCLVQLKQLNASLRISKIFVQSQDLPKSMHVKLCVEMALRAGTFTAINFINPVQNFFNLCLVFYYHPNLFLLFNNIKLLFYLQKLIFLNYGKLKFTFNRFNDLLEIICNYLSLKYKEVEKL